MIGAIAKVVTIIFGVTAILLFWNLVNKFGAKISFNKLILILFGLALILLAIGCF